MNNLYNIWSDDATGVDFQYYPATSKITDAAVIILPGGAYAGHADHEGKGYAEMFNAFGLSAFVLKYRVIVPVEETFVLSFNVSLLPQLNVVNPVDVLSPAG